MKIKIVIHPDFEYLREYIEKVPQHFDSLGESVYNVRNVVRVDTVEGAKLVVKSFRRIYLPNKIRYTYFYPSKAQRAYDYARLLLAKGFQTPQPIAYIECFRQGLLRESFFISEYSDFLPLSTVKKAPFPDLELLLTEFARHTHELHQHQIYHKDYSLGNVLFKKIDNHYQFMLIDNNRMRFGTVNFRKGVRNLERLGLSVEQLALIAKAYANLCGVHEIISMERLFHYKRNQLRRKSWKNFGKRILKRGHTFAALLGE